MVERQLKLKRENKKGGFFDTVLGTLAVSLLGSVLLGKWVIQAR